MRVGIGLGITRRQGGDPIAALFRPAGRTGWRYPLTLDTLFQDAAGTTPVTAPGDPVGLVLDTSRGLALGPELAGGIAYVALAGTLPSATPGAFVARRDAGNTQNWIARLVGLTIGRTYRITFTATADALETGNAVGIIATRIGGAENIYTLGGAGNYTVYYQPTTTNDDGGSIRLQASPGNSFLASNISVRELPGNHKAQSTALNRPTYQVDDDGKPYLAYNGSNSSMATASFAWGSDKATICVGVRKLSDAGGFRPLVQFSVDTNSQNGSFSVFAPQFAGTPSYMFRSRGNAVANAAYNNAAVAAPVTNVLTAIGDIAGDSAILRVNGTQVVSSTSDQGSGNYGTHQLFFGTGEVGLFFNGREYPSIGINAALTASELAMVEAWVTQRTGALG